MRVAALAFAVGLASCALTASDIPAIASGISEVARLVKQHTGRDLAAVPVVCETENHPASGKLLLLCTVCYRLAPGEVCK